MQGKYIHKLLISEYTYLHKVGISGHKNMRKSFPIKTALLIYLKLESKIPISAALQFMTCVISSLSLFSKNFKFKCVTSIHCITLRTRQFASCLKVT